MIHRLRALVVMAMMLAGRVAGRGTDAVQVERDVNDSRADVAHDNNHTGHHPHGVSVVHLQFEYVEQPLILTLFLIFVVLIKIGQSYQTNEFDS